MIVTILGSGTSQGVPVIGCTCPVCLSTDPRDKRLRAAALVEYGGLTILVDAGPDLRWQMLRAGVRHLDAILLTHNHKDHTAGLDDVRAFNLCERHPVNIYCQPYVEDTLRREYAYAFAEQKYPGAPEWHLHRIDGAHPFLVHSNAGEEVLSWERGFGYHHLPPQSDADATAEVIPIQGWHHREKKLSVLGYRFGNIAYLTDIKMLDSEAEFDKLKGVEYVTWAALRSATITRIPPCRRRWISLRGWARGNPTSRTCRTNSPATKRSPRCSRPTSIPPGTDWSSDNYRTRSLWSTSPNHS